MFIFLARLGRFIISCSKLHSAIFLLHYHVYISFYFDFQSHTNFRIQAHAYVIHFFLWSNQDSYFPPDTGRSRYNNFPKILVPCDSRHLLFGFNHSGFSHHIVNNSLVFLFFLEPPLDMESLLCSLLG